jgi:prepilin-type processing-associated H-X9-DG protein
MAIPHATSGEVLDIRSLGAVISGAVTHTVVKTAGLEVIRVLLAANRELPPHQVPGEITVQCLEGKVTFRAAGVERELSAGNFLFLDGGVEHAVRALEDSSLLVTIVLRHKE